ncbi:hypothetical protein ACLB1E_31810 [Escherichia coli]
MVAAKKWLFSASACQRLSLALSGAGKPFWMLFYLSPVVLA